MICRFTITFHSFLKAHKTIPHRVMWKRYLILKPVWFLAFPRPNGLMAGREKTKAWLPARHVVQAGSYPRTGKRRGLYSDNFFGFSPKTILR